MAYTTATAPATGKTLAFDGDFPRSKMVFGAEGSQTDVSPVDPLPVALDAADPAITALAALIGEVQASPTANTLLDRLKTIAAGVTTLSGYVDGLEGLATALNGYVDGIEALIGTTNMTLNALNGYVDGLETLQGTTNTSLTALQGFVDGLETLLADNLTTAAFQARIPTLGAKASSGSVSIVPASDAAFPLPTGAATNAKLDEAIAALNEQRGGDKFAAITPADTNLATVPDAIYVGGAGNLVVRGSNGTDATFVVTAGALLPIRPTQVRASTTATGIVGINN